MHVAAGVVVRALNVACTAFTSGRIVGVQVPEAVFARVTAASFDVLFAVAGARFDSVIFIGERVADTVVQRTDGVTIAG